MEIYRETLDAFRTIKCVQYLQRLSVNGCNIHQSEVFANLCSTNCRGPLDHGRPTRRLARSCYAVRGHVCCKLCTYYINYTRISAIGYTIYGDIYMRGPRTSPQLHLWPQTPLASTVCQTFHATLR